MDTLITVVYVILQAIFGVILFLVGILPGTYKQVNGKKLTILGWSMVILGGLGFILSTTIVEINKNRSEKILSEQLVEIKEELIESTRREEKLGQDLDEMREKLYPDIAPFVMEAPKEITPAPIPEPSFEIQITSPHDGSEVLWRTYAEGKISDLDAEVWVIVHPMDVSAYWVQPSVSVKEDGTWKVQIYLGRAEDIDVGKKFEIVAVANPSDVFSEADILGGWPDAQWSSQVVTVTRE